MEHVGFYAGSFDPVTNGHLDVIRQACRIVDRLYVAVGINDTKKTLFSFEERVILLQDACSHLKLNNQIIPIGFKGLAVEAARDNGAQILVRGIRDTSDFDFEMRMATMNRELAADIQTVFVTASPSVSFIAGTFVRQIALSGGDVSRFVPPLTHKMLQERYQALAD